VKQDVEVGRSAIDLPLATTSKFPEGERNKKPWHDRHAGLIERGKPRSEDTLLQEYATWGGMIEAETNGRLKVWPWPLITALPRVKGLQFELSPPHDTHLTLRLTVQCMLLRWRMLSIRANFDEC